jgi:hypothetical protein
MTADSSLFPSTATATATRTTMTTTTSSQQSPSVLSQQDIQHRSLLLVEAKDLLWKLDDYDYKDEIKIQKQQSSSSSSTFTMKKLATLYDRLCETLSSDTFQNEVIDNNSNNDDNVSFGGIWSNNDDTNSKPHDYTFQIQQPRLSPATLPWQLEWELYQSLQLTSLHLLVELQKIITATMDSSSAMVGIMLENKKSTLRSTIRQCQYLVSKLSLLKDGSIITPTTTTTTTKTKTTNQDDHHHHHDNKTTVGEKTTTTSNSSRMTNNINPMLLSWKQRIQHLINKHPTLLLLSPQEQAFSSASFPQHREETEEVEHEQEEETNFLPYLNKEELALEEQTLMQMADTPIPRRPPPQLLPQ